MKLSQNFKMGIHPEIEVRLKRWKEQLVERRNAEAAFRKPEAMKKSLFAQMLLKEREKSRQSGEGKISVAELEYRVYASHEWASFAESLAQAETEYNFQSGLYEIRSAAYYGMKDTFKHEGTLDKRQGA